MSSPLKSEPKPKPFISDAAFDRALFEMDEADKLKSRMRYQLRKENEKKDEYRREQKESCKKEQQLNCTRCKSIHEEITKREEKLLIERNELSKLKSKMIGDCSGGNTCNRCDEIEQQLKIIDKNILEIHAYFNPWYYEESKEFGGGFTKKRRQPRAKSKRRKVKSAKYKP